MADPILEIRGLRLSIRTDEGIAQVLAHIDFTLERGTIRFNGEDLLELGEHELNTRIRGSRISFIPQDPYLALNPVFKVGTQLLEIMRWHAPDSRPRGARDKR